MTLAGKPLTLPIILRVQHPPVRH